MSIVEFPKKKLGDNIVVHTDSDLHERLSVQPYVHKGNLYVNVTSEADGQHATVIGVELKYLIRSLEDLEVLGCN